MIWKRGSNNSPPGTRGVARRSGLVVKSKWFSWIPMNEWDGELFDPSTTPSLRATPPVPGVELFLPLLQLIHTFYDRAYNAVCSGKAFAHIQQQLIGRVDPNQTQSWKFKIDDHVS